MILIRSMYVYKATSLCYLQSEVVQLTNYFTGEYTVHGELRDSGKVHVRKSSGFGIAHSAGLPVPVYVC